VKVETCTDVSLLWSSDVAPFESHNKIIPRIS